MLKKEFRILKRLDTPGKIQSFLNKIPMNFEEDEDSCMSPLMVLRKNKCHCIEGAMLAALAFKLQGKKPLIVDMKASRQDDDHVIAVFKEGGKWGCVSKTNHGVLRYREPVYRDIRELIMSFFHEYTNKSGIKTLRSYSLPVDLSIFDSQNWMDSEEDIWFVPEHLVNIKHYAILSRGQAARLKKADEIEIKIGKVVEWTQHKFS